MCRGARCEQRAGRIGLSRRAVHRERDGTRKGTSERTKTKVMVRSGPVFYVPCAAIAQALELSCRMLSWLSGPRSKKARFVIGYSIGPDHAIRATAARACQADFLMMIWSVLASWCVRSARAHGTARWCNKSPCQGFPPACSTPKCRAQCSSNMKCSTM